MSENELVLLCKEGDREALKRLYEEYAPYLMGISFRYTGSREQSQDILHDSFVKIFGSMERFEYKGVGSLKAWISRITVNTALDNLHKKSNLRLLEEKYAGDVAESESEKEQIELYEKVSNSVIIEHIGRLPVALRVIFNMYIFEDMPRAEIATRLGITEQASRVRLHRAKQILAAELKKYLKTE